MELPVLLVMEEIAKVCQPPFQERVQEHTQERVAEQIAHFPVPPVSASGAGAHPRKLAEQIMDVPDARLRKDTVEVTTTVSHERTSERIIVDVPCAADHQEHR